MTEGAPSRRRLPLEAARAIARAVPPLGVERVPIDSSAGRVLRDALVAAVDLPPVDRAAMDGWAAWGAPPWRLDSDPGSGPAEQPRPGFARPIATGAPLPPSTLVIRTETARLHDGLLEVDDPRELEPGRHVRRRGEEARAGDLLLPAGCRLTPARIALAATAGADHLSVGRRPTVRVIVTGDELHGRGLPTAERVRDAFSPQLATTLRSLGADPTDIVRMPDDLEALVDALGAAREDLVLTTGGTAGSAADHLRAALGALGVEWLIDGIAVRPGGPTQLAQRPDGPLVLALPGNPLAALAMLAVLGRDLLDALAGAVPGAPLRLAVAGGDPGHPGASTLRPVRCGEHGAQPTGRDGSAMLRGLAEAEGLLVLPPGGVAPGGLAEFVALPGPG